MSGNSNSIKRILSNSIIYTFSGLLIKCFNFFLLPLYTAYLSTNDYGITSIATSFLSTMSYIASFSLYSAVMRFYVDLKDDSEKLKRFYGSIISFVFLSSIGFGIVLTLGRGLLSRFVFSGVGFFPVIVICLVSMLFNCQYNIYENILRSQQKAGKCSILSVTYFLIIIGCNLCFVVHLKMGAPGVLLSTLIASLLYTLFFWGDMLSSRAAVLCLDFKLLKDALGYSIPIMPHNLSTQIAELFSKALLGGVDSLSSVGIFSIATQFGTIADTVQIYVNNAYGPWLYEKLHAKDDGYKLEIRDTVKLLCAAIGFFFIGVALFSQDYILIFLNKSYSQAWMYVPLIVEMYAIKTVYWFYVNILFYFKKASKVLFTATLSGSLINVLLSFFFIRWWGIVGSIAADIIAMSIRVTIVVYISKQYEDIGLKMADFVKNFITVSLFIFVGLLPSYLARVQVFSFKNLLYKVLIIAVYILIVCVQYKSKLMVLIEEIHNR